MAAIAEGSTSLSAPTFWDYWTGHGNGVACVIIAASPRRVRATIPLDKDEVIGIHEGTGYTAEYGHEQVVALIVPPDVFRFRLGTRIPEDWKSDDTQLRKWLARLGEDMALVIRTDTAPHSAALYGANPQLDRKMSKPTFHRTPPKGDATRITWQIPGIPDTDTYRYITC